MSLKINETKTKYMSMRKMKEKSDEDIIVQLLRNKELRVQLHVPGSTGYERRKYKEARLVKGLWNHF